MEMDASVKAFGAVLVQKKDDGYEHPMFLASQTMKSAERNYSTCEIESLAVIFALLKLRIYLFSDEQFTMVTDHKSLQYEFQKRIFHGIIARRMDFLAEYDLKDKYGEGSKNGAADVLSRNED